jgi:hypothetical protein
VGSKNEIACGWRASWEAPGGERPAQDPVEAVMAHTGGLGADVVLYCAASTSAKPVEQAMAMFIDRGTVVIVGAVDMVFPRPHFFKKELQIRIGRSYGPGRYDPAYEVDGHDYPIGYVRWTENRNMGEFVRLLEAGPVALMITTGPVRGCPERHELVSAGRRDAGGHLEVRLIRRDEHCAACRPCAFLSLARHRHARIAAGPCCPTCWTLPKRWGSRGDRVIAGLHRHGPYPPGGCQARNEEVLSDRRYPGLVYGYVMSTLNHGDALKVVEQVGLPGVVGIKLWVSVVTRRAIDRSTGGAGQARSRC